MDIKGKSPEKEQVQRAKESFWVEQRWKRISLIYKMHQHRHYTEKQRLDVNYICLKMRELSPEAFAFPLKPLSPDPLHKRRSKNLRESHRLSLLLTVTCWLHLQQLISPSKGRAAWTYPGPAWEFRNKPSCCKVKGLEPLLSKGLCGSRIFYDPQWESAHSLHKGNIPHFHGNAPKSPPLPWPVSEKKGWIQDRLLGTAALCWVVCSQLPPQGALSTPQLPNCVSYGDLSCISHSSGKPQGN